MVLTVHIIDPDADTVIVLTNPSTSFAPWVPVAAEPVEESIASIEEVPTFDSYRGLSKAQKKKLEKQQKADRMQMKLAEERRAIAETEGSTIGAERVEHANGFPMGEGSATATVPEVSLPQHGEDSPSPEPAQINEPVEEEIHYHVSSRHLQLASSWFKRALTKEAWAESELVDGQYRISAQDWDEDALLLVLNILHLRNKQVPRTVSLDMLAKIAILVDYYSCGEAVELFTDMWIKDAKMKAAVPQSYCRDLVLWIWISWVFDLSQQFAKATAVAVSQCTEAMQTLNLPISEKVTSELRLTT